MPAHAAETHIGDDHQKLPVREQPQGFLGRFRRARGIAFIAEHCGERAAHVLLVIHDEHGRQGEAHDTMGLFGDFAGKVMMNFAP